MVVIFSVCDARCLDMWSQQRSRIAPTETIMELDEVLVLLSLREGQIGSKKKFEYPTDKGGSMDLDYPVDMEDAMDIDSIEFEDIEEPTFPEPEDVPQRPPEEPSMPLEVPPVPPKPPVYELEEEEEQQQPEEPQVEEVLERLLVRLLSPTNLGAQFALNQHKQSDDGEQPLPTPSENRFYPVQRHQSSFATGTNVFQRVNEPQEEPHQNQSSFASGRNVFQRYNEPEQEEAHQHQYQYQHQKQQNHRFVPFPVQVHHHYYYFNGSESGGPEPRQRSSTSEPLEVPSVQLLEARNKSTQLPLPWDASSTPAEERAYLLSLYLQLAVNLVVLAYALHLVWSVVGAIRRDVTHKLSRHANNLLVEIALCERSYRENHCSPDEIVPALEQMCAYWEQCMLQDPARGGNVSSLGAQTIGMVLTSLVEPLSFKALAVFAAAVFLVYVYNFGFGYVRARTYWG